MRDLAGRTALVTGASHGLGTYIARALAAELGTTTPDDVARAVVRAIRRDLPEVIVNPRPMRLVLAFRELFPRLAEWVRVETFEQAATRGQSKRSGDASP